MHNHISSESARLFGMLMSPSLVQFAKMPLHHAAENQAGPELVAALLQVYPDAASKADQVCCGSDMARYV